VKTIQRQRRHERIAKKMRGTKAKPRLVVFRSQKHIYAQIIDDETQKILVAVTTNGKDFRANNPKTGNKDAAVKIGKLIAQIAKEKGITKVCFDRAGYKFHGRVKALSDGAREGGLEL